SRPPAPPGRLDNRTANRSAPGSGEEKEAPQAARLARVSTTRWDRSDVGRHRSCDRTCRYSTLAGNGGDDTGDSIGDAAGDAHGAQASDACKPAGAATGKALRI